jgi:hypothetical protein
VVNYLSGSGTNTLTFNYTVFAGETSADLDYASTTALAFNSATIRDAVGNNATLTLPAPGSFGSLGFNKNIVIDTATPTVSFMSTSPSSPGNSQTPIVNINLSEAAQLIRLFSDGSCTTGISPLTGTGTAGLNTITTNLLASGSTNNIRAQVTDLAGNVSTCTLMTTYVHDGAGPTVTSVTSSAVNGTYRTGQMVPINVVFSEVVSVTGTPRITLSTGGGASDAVVDYVSGSGTNTLTFNYTVAAGQTSADLNYGSTNALVPNGGTIRDQASNNADLTLPLTGGASSLASQKAIVIDTSPPSVTYTSVSPSSPNLSRTPTITMNLSEAANVTLWSDAGCSVTQISNTTALSAGAGQTITTYSLPVNTTTQINAKAVTALGNATGCLPMVAYAHDNAGPSVSSFARAGGASTNSTPVNFTIVFSEAIAAASFTPTDITNQGTATGVTWSVTATNSTTFTVAATAASSGTLQPRLAAGAVTDLAGNTSAGLMDSSNSVNYSPAALSVTVNQKVGQADPVSTVSAGAPVEFTIVFSAAVTSLTTGNITHGGTATGFTGSAALTTTDNITWKSWKIMSYIIF